MEVGKGPDAFYGSLISKVQFEKVLGYIETGKREGAKLEIGGLSAAPANSIPRQAKQGSGTFASQARALPPKATRVRASS